MMVNRGSTLLVTVIMVSATLFGLFLNIPYEGIKDDDDNAEDELQGNPAVPYEAGAPGTIDPPGVFYENRGQAGVGGGSYYVHGSTLSVAFGTGWVAYWLTDIEGNDVLIRVTFEGAEDVEPVGGEVQQGRANFLIGSDGEGWHRGIGLYKEVLYPSLWDGIDLVFRQSEGSLKYEFQLRPGADPGDIRLRYQGADTVRIGPQTGDLLVEAAGQVIRDDAPIAFQGTNEGPAVVPCTFLLIDGARVGFEVGDYDPSKELIIDPGIIFSVLLGGQRQDSPSSMITDDDGNIYIVGSTHSDSFPTTPGTLFPKKDPYGMYTGFLIKMDPTGEEIIFSTFIGGNRSDGASDLALDDERNVYVVGGTMSENFPTTEGAYCTTLTRSKATLPGQEFPIPSSDTFVLKLDPKGSTLEFSTFIGGGWDEFGGNICVEPNGTVVVVGSTESEDFPTAGDPYQEDHGEMDDADDDIFFLRLSADGSELLYSSFFGGDYYDYASGLFLDSDGNMVISGRTGSSDLTFTDGAFDTKVNDDPYMLDGFVLKFNFTTNEPDYLTMVGGNVTVGYMVATLAEDGTVYFAGQTKEPNAVVNPNGTTLHWDVTIGRLSKDGSSRLSFDSFGGNKWDSPTDIEVDEDGRIYIQGQTTSTDFPTTEGAVCTTFVKNNLCFLTVLNEDASEVLYSTYYGSSGRDGADGLELDDQGGVIMTGDTQFRGDHYDPWTDFPTTLDPYTNGARVSHIATYLIKIHPMLILPEVINLTEGDVLYAGYKAYDFTVDANPFRASEGPHSVEMVLDPDGANVSVVWETLRSHPWSRFEERDPNGYIDLETSSYPVLDEVNHTLVLHIHIMVDWDWPHEDWCDIRIDIMGGGAEVRGILIEDVFRVENDLDMCGDLAPVGEWQGPLADGNWVRVGENIDFVGVQVVYEGTTDIHPLPWTCIAQVEDNDGNQSRNYVGYNGSVNVTLEADNDTDRDEVFRLSLVDLPFGASSVSTRTIKLGIDGQVPRFIRFIPESDDWHSSSDVLLSMTANDGFTSGVDSTTFEYQISSNGTAWYGPWERVGLQTTPSGPTADAMVEVHLPNGDDNFVRWRVSDHVGNQVTSEDHQVKVDTINVTYTDPSPGPEYWSTDPVVVCYITIQDMDGSGINVSTIQYRFSPHNLSSYGSWLDWDELLTVDNVVVRPSVMVDLADTRYNYIQWRAMDLAGNGFTTSRHYRVQVDATPIVFSDFTPGADVWHTDPEVRCTITAYDGPLGSGIDQSTIEYRCRHPGGEFTEWGLAGMGGVASEQRFSIVVTLAEGVDNVVQFRARDVAGNGPTLSDEFKIDVDLTPPQAALGNVFRVEDDGESTTYRVSVLLRDTLSGLDLDSVTVAHGEVYGIPLSDWSSVTLTEDGDRYVATFEIEVPSFMAPVVGIRSSDIAGNEMESFTTPILINRPPVAVIASPLDVSVHTAGEAIFLSANGSHDPDSVRLSYAWQIVNASGKGNFSLITTDREGIITLTEGEFLITLTVIDPQNVIDIVNVTVTVVPPPSPKMEPTDEFPNLVLLLLLVMVIGAVAAFFLHKGRAEA